MPVLISAVVFVGILCAVDLVLTLAVIRRLREHTIRLAEGGAMAPPPPVATGTPVREFTATALDGRTVTPAFFTGPTVVGVLSTTCPGCRERLPELAQYLAANEGRPALVLVQGEPEPAREFTDVLSPLATVVVEPPGGKMSEALHIARVPTFYVVDENAVIVTVTGKPGELALTAVRA